MMFSTPTTSSITPANTHQPLIRLSSFMRLTFRQESLTAFGWRYQKGGSPSACDLLRCETIWLYVWVTGSAIRSGIIALLALALLAPAVARARLRVVEIGGEPGAGASSIRVG